MAEKCYTKQDVRIAFVKRVGQIGQAQLARDARVKPQYVSAMWNEREEITGRVLQILGFERVEQHYRKVK